MRKILSFLLPVFLLLVGQPVWGTDATFNWASGGNMGSNATGTVGQITLTGAANSASGAPTVTSNTLRLYAHRSSGNGASATFTAATGCTITAIEVKCTGGANVLKYATNGGSTFSAFSFTNQIATVSDLNASSITLKNCQSSGNSNTTIQIAHVIITYSLPPCVAPTFNVDNAEPVTKNTVVTISSSTTGSTIYYTTDGNTPTTGSAHGTAGTASVNVTISDNMTIKAMAVKDGMSNSSVASREYTIAKADNTIEVTGGTTHNISLVGGSAVEDYTLSATASHGTVGFAIKSVTNLVQGTDFDFEDDYFIFYNKYKGIIVVTASVPADADYNAVSTDITINISGNKRDPVFTFDDDLELAIGEHKSFVLATDVIADEGATITLATDDNTTATVDNENVKVTAVALGECIITVSVTEGTYYNDGEKDILLSVISPKGSSSNPYTVTDVIDGTATGSDKYVVGYIVGSYGNGNTSGFARSGASSTNLAIADDPNENDVDYTAAVQLPSGTIRNNFNVSDHLAFIGVLKILVKADITGYITTKGLKNTDEITIKAAAVNVTSAGWASAYIDFKTKIPDGLTAYYASNATNSSVTLTEIQGNKVLPNNFGVIVAGYEGVYDFELSALTPAVDKNDVTNKFGGVVTTTPVASITPESGNSLYVLGKENDNVGFYLPSNSLVNLAPYKAYLIAPSQPTSAPGIQFVFEGATNINNIEAIDDAVKFIQDGKLYIKKNGVVYDLLGTVVR